MEKRRMLLLGCFIAFYYLVHMIYDMPNLVHGNPAFDWLPTTVKGWLARIGDITFCYFLALAPYELLLDSWAERRWAKIILILAALLPSIFLARYWMEHFVTPKGLRLRSFFLGHLFYMGISFVFGIIFFFVRWSHFTELQQKELEIQHRRSELSFLRSQVNPHFLFNSLNNIYSLVYQGSDQALKAIAGLSDLLRYMLYDAAELVPLATEMDYIRKYIALQQLRFETPVQIDIQEEGSADGVRIPPLLLIPFVENAFKHGDLAKAGLTILLRCTPGKTLFYCTNRKGTQQKDPGGGIGVENVRRRVALLFPGKHVFLVEDGPINFSINLELKHD